MLDDSHVPLAGCPNAPFVYGGYHQWDRGEIDVFETFSGDPPGPILGESVDTCRQCGLKVTVQIKNPEA